MDSLVAFQSIECCIIRFLQTLETRSARLLGQYDMLNLLYNILFPAKIKIVGRLSILPNSSRHNTILPT